MILSAQQFANMHGISLRYANMRLRALERQYAASWIGRGIYHVLERDPAHAVHPLDKRVKP